MRRRAFPAIVGVVVALLVAIMVLLVLWATRVLPTPDGLIPPSGPPSIPSASLEVEEQSGDTPALTDGLGPDSAEIASAWKVLADVAAEGEWTPWVRVVDADTGAVVFAANDDVAHTPASTMKILTALFALSTLDPAQTLTTGVSQEGSTLYLWGEGDLLLSAGTSDPTVVDGRAGLATLAADTARVLETQGVDVVTLKYQASLFPGALRPEGWIEQEVTDFGGDVGAFAIDTGRTSPGTWQFVDDSARVVADTFSKALADQGVKVDSVSSGQAPPTARQVAAVQSASTVEQVEFLLLTSDNTMAEQYCHLAASQQLGTDASLSDSAAELTDFLERSGVETSEFVAYDCSGLDSRSRLRAKTLTDAIALSGQGTGPEVSLVRFFPVGGVSGTLSGRFETGPSHGNVVAKTGSLGSVATVSGVVTSESGQVLIFALGADGVPDDAAAWYRPDLDRFITALAQS